VRKPAPCTGFSSLRHRHSPKADTIRFGLPLCRTAAVVALVLLAAPAFAVTTNVTVAGVPPDQVQKAAPSSCRCRGPLTRIASRKRASR